MLQYYQQSQQAGGWLLPIRWMAPESFYDGVWNVETDAWMLGVLIWGFYTRITLDRSLLITSHSLEIFSFGELPWRDVPDSQVMRSIKQTKKLSQPKVCPPEVYNIMQGCWKLDASVRLSSQTVSDQLVTLFKRTGKDESSISWPGANGLSAVVNEAQDTINGIDVTSLAFQRRFEELEIDRGQMVFGRQLGKGAFGSVHMISIDGQEYAAKTLNSDSTELQEKFLLETKLLCALSHASVVRLVHVCARTMPYVMVVELMGTDLKGYLAGKDASIVGLDELVGACLQIAQAMSYLSSFKVIHRDLAARCGYLVK